MNDHKRILATALAALTLSVGMGSAAQAQSTSNTLLAKTEHFTRGERLGDCTGYFAAFNWMLIGLGNSLERDYYLELEAPADALYQRLNDTYTAEQTRLMERQGPEAAADFVGGFIEAHERAIPTYFEKFVEEPDTMPDRVEDLIRVCNRLFPVQPNLQQTTDQADGQ